MMRFSLKTLSLAAALWCAGAMALWAGDSMPVAVGPASIWNVAPASGDQAQVAEEEGMLHVKYDVNIQTQRRIQHVTYYETALMLELKNPVAVDPELTRVSFEARGQDGSAEDRTGTVFIRPVVEDQSGERFSYEPYRVLLLKQGKPGEWARWNTRPFRASEAGGASPNIYVASGGDQNAWPDGALRFVGFEVRFRVTSGGTEKGRRKGDLYITGVKLDPTRLQEEVSGYADAFVSAKGRYRASFQVRPAFQANPMDEFSTQVDFDPASEQSRKQRIAVPSAGKLANSWVRYRFENEAGAIVSEGDLRWEADLKPGAVPPAVKVTEPPAIGCVRVNPIKATIGVYAPGEPLNVTFRVFKKTERPAKKIRWALKTYAYSEPLTDGEAAISGKGQAFDDVVVKLQKPGNETALRLQYALLDAAGAEVDRGQYVLGIGGRGAAIPALHSRQGVLPDRNEIKKQPYNRFTFHLGDAPAKTSEELIKRFTASLDEGRQVADHVTYMIDLAEFEVLPGVYDFSNLDRVMDVAADRRCGVTIRLCHIEKFMPYLWLPYTRVRDFDGGVIVGHPMYKAISIADTEYRKAWLAAFKAFYDRYQAHPAFEGYYIMMPSGEMNIPDEIWHGRIADYSWTAAEAFRDYLKGDLGLTLEQLNQRWHTEYAAWNAVLPPQPDWSVGTRPDLRPQWMDFERFKLKLKDQWAPVISRDIRKFDTRRVIIAYGTPSEFEQPEGEANIIDYAHNGGNHFLNHEGEYIRAWDHGKGVGWITEPHHPHRWAAYGDPAQKGWVLDWSVFVMLAQAGGAGANLHFYYKPNPTYALAPHYGGEYSYDRVEQYKPILRELFGLEVAAPAKQVAVLRDSSTLLSKHRTILDGRLGDLSRWFELLTSDSVPWENYVAGHEKNYKALFLNPLDQVLSADSIATVDRMARHGATVVLSAGTGRYCAEDPQSEYPLLRKLGIEWPVGAYDIASSRVSAAVEPAFRDTLGRDKIAFYSQADMREELRDPAIGADFYRWPYRWLPQSDYFGHFAGVQLKSGEVLARFADGGVALSRHKVGNGLAVVFWGSPDITPERVKGLMGKIADAAGVVNPQAGNAIPYMLEGKSKATGRNYALLYQETPGTFTQKLPNVPDGEWFVDEMLSGQRFGTFAGNVLREKGISVVYEPGVPPLKVLRLYRFDGKYWADKYPKTLK